MSKTLRLLLYTTLATVLVVACSIGRVAASNSDLLMVYTLVRPFVFLTSVGFLILGVVFLINKRLFSIVPLILIGIFYFSFLAALMPAFAHGTWVSGAVVVAILGLIIYAVRNVETLEIAKKSLLFSAAMLVPFMHPVVGLIIQDSPPVISKEFKTFVDGLSPEQVDQSRLPDVIYIVPDRYASEKTLKTVYGVENERFYSELRKRGFSVQSNASANYPTTAHSLSSTQNSGYLDGFAKRYGAQSSSVQPLYSAIENSLAQQAMRRLGYGFINAGSWWDGTRYNRMADANYGTYLDDGFSRLLMSEVESILIQSSAVPALFDLKDVLYGPVECQRIKRKLNWLSKVGNQAKPVFVLAHMTMPHNPIVADGEGNCFPHARARYPSPGHKFSDRKSAYAEYLRYFNRALLDLFDQQKQQRASGGRGLVFVVQSDEGPYPKQMLSQGRKKTIADLPHPDLKTKIGSINAIYLNGETNVHPDELKTPINNWRLILERLTGKPLQRETHKVYIYKDYSALYDFREVGPDLLN